jgi:hypothetical protein
MLKKLTLLEKVYSVRNFELGTRSSEQAYYPHTHNGGETK